MTRFGADRAAAAAAAAGKAEPLPPPLLCRVTCTPAGHADYPVYLNIRNGFGDERRDCPLTIAQAEYLALRLLDAIRAAKADAVALPPQAPGAGHSPGLASSADAAGVRSHLRPSADAVSPDPSPSPALIATQCAAPVPAGGMAGGHLFAGRRHAAPGIRGQEDHS